MNIGKVLSRAWEIIWKHKVLWIFGILASCGQGGGGGGGGNTGFRFSEDELNVPPQVERFFFGLERFFQQVEVWQIVAFVVILMLIFLALWFIMLALSTIGRLGLIQGTAQVESRVEKLNFTELFNEGKPFFWRVLGLNVLVGLAIFILVMALVLPAVGITALTFDVGLFCLIPLICLLIPVSWGITILLEHVNIAIVLEDLNIISGIQRGWEVFKENLVNILVMGLILGIGGGIVGVIIALPLFFLVFPAVFGGILGSVTDSTAPIGSGLAVAGLCFVVYLPILIVLGGILRAYIQSAWTLTYMKLTQIPQDESEGPKPISLTTE